MMKMQAIVIFLVLCFATSTLTAVENPIGQVIAVQGKVTAVGTDGKSRNLELKSPVFLNDRVATEEGSKIQIMFDDDSIISQGEKSEMTIDKYIYAPAEKDKNCCSVELAKGIFKLITGKITKLNPERFKVQTKMATIGIRGCELGFKITQIEEDIYVIDLRGRESVIVQVRPHIEVAGRRLLNVAKRNRVISITPGVGVEEREITSDELASLIEAVTPGPEPGPKEEQKPEKPEPGLEPEPAQAPVTLLEAPQRPEPPPLNPLQAPEVESEPEPETEPETETETEIEPVAEQGSTSTFVLGGQGADWSWGTWYVNGLLDRVDFYYNANILSVADYQAIQSGATRYNLTGDGSAAAVIEYAGTKNRVTGTCNLNVQVGNSITPCWDGSFAMDNTAGDSLNFGAAGNIQTDGGLTGNQTSYQMKVKDRTFYRHEITAESISGNLVGPSGAVRPTGAIGAYHFEHGATATVDGGFGADLQ